MAAAKVWAALISSRLIANDYSRQRISAADTALRDDQSSDSLAARQVLPGMSMTALVVGGTGPTGPFIVNGLLERGYRATILHRGTHEIPEVPAAVEHIHADPHFRETLDSALAGRNFDVVIATYGRLRVVAEALKGKTPHFIGVGGVASYRGFYRPTAVFPTGLRTPTPEDAPTVASEEDQRFAYLIASTEQAVLRCRIRPGRSFDIHTYMVLIQLVPREWSVIRRILDKRPYIIVADGGLTLMTHGYAANLAHAILLAVDRPEASAGQIYNCGDERQLTVRHLIELIRSEMNYACVIIGVPYVVGPGASPLTFHDTLVTIASWIFSRSRPTWATKTFSLPKKH